MEWLDIQQNEKKMLASHLSDKGTISRLYQQLKQLNKNQPIDKWAKHHSRQTKKKNTNNQQIYEELPHIMSHQGNANQNRNVVSPHLH